MATTEDYLAIRDQNDAVIDGGVPSGTYANDFQISGYTLGALQEVSEGQGAGTGRAVYEPLTVTLNPDTPGVNTLTADAGSGTVLKSVTLYVTTSAGVIEQVVLTNATVVEAQAGGGGTAISFNYQKIAITPYHQTDTGTLVKGDVITASPGSFVAPPAVTVPTAPTGENEAMYLKVSGITGPSTAASYSGDFTATGYQFEVGTDGHAGPLVVSLGDLGNSLGVTDLESDVWSGKVIPTVTLDVTKTIGESTTATLVEQIVLTDAVETTYVEPGGQVSVSFEYQSATLTSRLENANGTFGNPQTVTLTGGGSGGGAGSEVSVSPGEASNQFDYLAIRDQNDAVIDGGVPSGTYANDFQISGYTLGALQEVSEGQGAGTGRAVYEPLTVTLNPDTPGVNTLTADAGSGTVLKSVTLYVTTSAGVIEQVVLTNATVVEAQAGGGGTAISFNYQKIAITPYHQTDTGTLVKGDVITASPGSFVAPPAVTVPTAPTGDNEAMYLKVSGITGPSTAASYSGDFTATGYQFEVGTDGHAGPLVVSLGDLGNSLGVTDLESDVWSGKVIPTVTLDVTKTIGESTTATLVEQIVLTDAVETTYVEPGGQVSVSFEYQSATLTSRLENANGTFGNPQTVTIPGEVACFHRGTRIRTATTDKPIETLQVGELVRTASGELRPVRWLGSRGIDCARHPDPSAVWPICIRAGAFAEQQPARDLWLSPGHALCVDGVLIQAEKLVNGATIMQVPQTRVEYWHVELDSHDVVLAEGLPAESYLDTGNRTAFANGGAFIDAFPDFRPKHWADTCVPLILDGPALKEAKSNLLARARTLGFAITHDSGPHVVADGQRIEPMHLSDTRLMFTMPPACSRIELRSRTFIPTQIDPRSTDQRSLGICVGRLQLDGDDLNLEDDMAFVNGWHALERLADGGRQRWTRERVPLPAGARVVMIDIVGASHCWVAPIEAAAARCG